MGRLDKDIHQKESAVRFCVLTGYLPFLEVNVENHKELSDTSTIITDIDTLGVLVDFRSGLRRVIFDCKTLNKVSPINRAFWAAGLMQYTQCDEAFIVLRKKASEAHRLSAKYMNVHLFNERQFANYSESYSLDYKIDYCYSTNIKSWIVYESIYANNRSFEKFGKFLSSEVPLETDATRGMKRLLAALQKGKGEFNPDKVEHVAVFQNALMSFSYLMSQIIYDLKSIIDFDSDKNDFDKILKYYIWGGRESFLKRQKMSKLFSSANQSFSQIEPELKEWDSFVELVRKLLDSPADVFRCCFPMREIAFRNLVEKEERKEIHLSRYIKSSSRIRQFLTSQAKYLVKATQLPLEFNDGLSSVFDEIRDKA